MRRLLALLLLTAVGSAPVAAATCPLPVQDGPPTASHEHRHGGAAAAADEPDSSDGSDTGRSAGAGCAMAVACGAAGIVALPAGFVSAPPPASLPDTSLAAAAATPTDLTCDPPPPRLPV